MQVEPVAAASAAPPPVVETPVIDPKPIADAVANAIKAEPDTPESREAALTDELSAVWDKQVTNGVEKDEKGRFVAKEGDKPETHSADQPQAAQPEPATPPAIEPPHAWSAEARAYWAKLPPEAQSYIAQREGESHKAITSYGERLKSYEPLEGVLGTFKDDIARRGVQPAQAVAMLLNAQRKLDANPLDGLVNIGLTYGIDLRPLLQGQQPNAQPQPDPRVQKLEQQVNDLTRQLQSRQQQEADQQTAQAEAIIAEFKKDKPYFADVETEMLALIPALKQRHPDASSKDMLAKVYDAAIHANSTIRERILSDQRKADEEKREKEAAAKAEEAKKSGRVNVRSATAQPTPKTMDETIDELARRAYG